MRHTIEEYVRWEDIDAAGIINYQSYLRIFGNAEVELFRACGLTYAVLFDELGVFLPRVHLECDFRVPVRLDELLLVDASIGRIGSTSIRIDFAARRKTAPDVVIAQGSYTVVTVRRGGFEPVEVPELIRERLRPYIESRES